MLKVRLFSGLSEAASSVSTPLPAIAVLCLCLLFALAKPAYAQGLLIAPSSAVFGTVTAGTTSPAFSFAVTNNTTAPAVYDKKLGSPSFIVQPGTCRLDDSDTAVAAGATCVFTVQFAPTASGAEAGSLNFSTSLGPITFPMSGTGLSASSGAIAIAPSAGDFGYVPVGETGPATSFTLTNHTTSTTEELGYTNFGEFSLRPGTCHLVSAN